MSTGLAPHARPLFGDHAVGPLAATLLQATTLGLSVDQIGREFPYVHPAPTEVVDRALLEL